MIETCKYLPFYISVSNPSCKVLRETPWNSKVTIDFISVSILKLGTIPFLNFKSSMFFTTFFGKICLFYTFFGKIGAFYQFFGKIRAFYSFFGKICAFPLFFCTTLVFCSFFLSSLLWRVSFKHNNFTHFRNGYMPALWA